ncbi:hypothetical protein ACHQM5_015410 [Ranunculus cassubicifolius]
MVNQPADTWSVVCDRINSRRQHCSKEEKRETKKGVKTRCDHPAENWLCLSCKDVFCSRFVNKHMLQHYQEKGHCLALSYSDLSVWCFSCDAYLDVQAILQLRPVYEIAPLLKFREAPPSRTIECLQLRFDQVESSQDRVILRASDGNVTFIRSYSYIIWCY